MILILTKHPSYSFSCVTPYICVFCRNEENEMKSKQFGPELSKLCKEEVMVPQDLMVATIGQCKLKPMQPSLGEVATTVATIEPIFSKHL